MATGKQNKLIGQIGEHLVAAKLGTMGILATPFSGNVPDFDISAVDPESGNIFVIKGKTSTAFLDQSNQVMYVPCIPSKSLLI